MVKLLLTNFLQTNLNFKSKSIRNTIMKNKNLPGFENSTLSIEDQKFLKKSRESADKCLLAMEKNKTLSSMLTGLMVGGILGVVVLSMLSYFALSLL